MESAIVGAPDDAAHRVLCSGSRLGQHGDGLSQGMAAPARVMGIDEGDLRTP
jgi:hypothetical protein